MIDLWFYVYMQDVNEVPKSLGKVLNPHASK